MSDDKLPHQAICCERVSVCLPLLCACSCFACAFSPLGILNQSFSPPFVSYLPPPCSLPCFLPSFLHSSPPHKYLITFLFLAFVPSSQMSTPFLLTFLPFILSPLPFLSHFPDISSSTLSLYFFFYSFPLSSLKAPPRRSSSCLFLLNHSSLSAIFKFLPLLPSPLLSSQMFTPLHSY